MALWKDPTKDPSMPGSDGAAALAAEPALRSVATPVPASAPAAAEPSRRGERAAPPAAGSAKESLIAADVTIEGKIEGAGHVRIAGRFKGDVNVQGNVTIEQGAHVTGQIAAATVMVSGEVHGNIQASSRVELLETGVINGDVKAAVLTVAAGSRMRGNADFGWPESAK
ncbi:MAG: polymer-forming cytoskeletal protein [Gammaproteobacteria bacterium]|nr:polymer-forming cytoskeletal protein [Gammaproteobacteria bacterium]MDH4312504.1 polymer-forming cytoskeletal protein [Gammaproteobacteria bacterium]MDH5272846.1 polymer-forming cytoskeletal protein [Gammaproteobacteria bacterium]